MLYPPCSGHKITACERKARLNRARELALELFDIANSFAGEESPYCDIAYYLHQANNNVIRAERTLDSIDAPVEGLEGQVRQGFVRGDVDRHVFEPGVAGQRTRLAMVDVQPESQRTGSAPHRFLRPGHPVAPGVETGGIDARIELPGPGVDVAQRTALEVAPQFHAARGVVGQGDTGKTMVAKAGEDIDAGCGQLRISKL